MGTLTPREIVIQVDKYVIGQKEAKCCVAIALRNRWRRQQVPQNLRNEIAPKNIIMIGPTGVGKTEIARRLARLADAPFLKVEASKFTEVGYVGRDVESMIRDLVELSVNIMRSQEQNKVYQKACELAEDRLLDILLPQRQANEREQINTDQKILDIVQKDEDINSTRNKLRKLLREGKLNERYVDLEVSTSQNLPMVEIFSASGLEDLDVNLRDMLGSILPKQSKRRKVKVPEAIEILTIEETSKLIDMDKVIQSALTKVEQEGIIFLDEIDKIVGRDHSRGPDVNFECLEEVNIILHRRNFDD